jgi:hypothetical protein
MLVRGWSSDAHRKAPAKTAGNGGRYDGNGYCRSKSAAKMAALQISATAKAKDLDWRVMESDCDL